jgi:hypothetical protein
MIPLERQAEREILAAVRQDMDSLFGDRQPTTAPEEERLAELVRVRVGRWQRARVNANLPVLPDPAAMEDAVMNWLVRLGPLEPLIRNPAHEEVLVDGPRGVAVIDRTSRTILKPDIYFDDDQEVRSWPSGPWRWLAGAWTRPRRWSTPACPTARGSTS